MPPTKKRARSPEPDQLSSTRQRTSIRIHQNRLVKRRWRGPPDDRIKAIEKLERGRRVEVVFQNTAYKPNPARAPQVNTRVHRTAPAPVTSPLRRSPGPAAPHSPPSLPEGGIEYEPDSFNISPVSSHVPLGSGLHRASSARDNRALFRQTQHLDDNTSAWTKRRHNQATQWRSIAIPRLMPAYLANRAATESGRLPPQPKPETQCRCNKVALKVELVTWDRQSSPHLLQLCSNCVLHQDPRRRYCPSASAIRPEYNYSKRATSPAPPSAQRSPLISTSWSL